jgi:hypothetical protein
MNTIEKNVVSVGKYVSTEHVDKVIRNYKQERWVQNSERLGKEDSLSIWWSMEELEEVLERAKVYGADGMRMYFGAYDKNDTENPQYAGRQTLVMVATKYKENADGSGRNKDIYVPTDDFGNHSILAYNRGLLCPPDCLKTVKTLVDDEPEIGITIVDMGEKGIAVV